MVESLRTRLLRHAFNLFPAYRFSGGKITYIRHDQREIHVKLPLSWRTRNYVGTIFGGSLYAAVDPIYMVMLIRVLGDDFTVWDKSARIQFEKPGRSTLFARFELTEEELPTFVPSTRASTRTENTRWASPTSLEPLTPPSRRRCMSAGMPPNRGSENR